MPLQILRLKVDSITAGDYLTWWRNPDPRALDFALRWISIAATHSATGSPRSSTATSLAPAPPAAATAAGLPLSPGVQIDNSMPHRHGDQRSAPQPDRKGEELIASATLGR